MELIVMQSCERGRGFKLKSNMTEMCTMIYYDFLLFTKLSFLQQLTNDLEQGDSDKLLEGGFS